MALTLKITAAPKIRQMYWCEFWDDCCVPEIGKRRPVVVISFKNTLHGIALVVPTSTDPQEGQSAQWAHKLSFKPDGVRESWVVCNHLYTVSTKRLWPLGDQGIVRLSEGEFAKIMTLVSAWLPRLPGA